MMYSRDYTNFFSQVFGKFLHHEPSPSVPAGSARLRENVRRHGRSFDAVFSTRDESWWPSLLVAGPAEFQQMSDCSVTLSA